MLLGHGKHNESRIPDSDEVEGYLTLWSTGMPLMERSHYGVKDPAEHLYLQSFGRQARYRGSAPSNPLHLPARNSPAPSKPTTRLPSSLPHLTVFLSSCVPGRWAP